MRHFATRYDTRPNLPERAPGWGCLSNAELAHVAIISAERVRARRRERAKRERAKRERAKRERAGRAGEG